MTSHVIDFAMVGGNHDKRIAVEAKTLAIVATAYSKDPPRPVLVGETCYEGPMAIDKNVSVQDVAYPALREKLEAAKQILRPEASKESGSPR